MSSAPPTLSMVWDILSEEQRDEAAKRVLEWLCSILTETDRKTVLNLMSYLNYHRSDLELALTHALKPEYRSRARDIAAALGVLSHG